MFYSKSYPFKKQDLLFMSMLLFGIAAILIGIPSQKNNRKATEGYVDIALNHDLAPPMAGSSWDNSEFFAPGIAATMGSATQTYYKDSPGCTNIRFVIRVFNTSTNGEALNNITIDIAPDVVIGDLIAGDINFNNQIDEGEVWAYEAFKLITETDMQAVNVFHQAHVEATVVGIGSIVSDDSHPSDMNLDGPTMTTINNCGVGVSLLLTDGVTKDGIGGDGGCASVELTYELHNTGFVGETFESVVLKDPNVGDILAPTSGDDINGGILDQGEVWIYKVLYVPTAEEWLAGQIEVQGYVEAISANQGQDILISDVSDPVDLNGHNTTIINISPCTPKISLLQTGVINNCNSIDFTYTVTNESDPNNGQGQILQGISVAELNLPVVLDGPFNDINNDLLMDPGEFWTYTAAYPLTAADIMAGEVVAQSNVAAFTDIPINMSVADISDFEDITQDRETVIDLSGCAPVIALVKQGVVSPDCSKIDYTFTVTNEGNNGLVFENVILTDPLLGGVIAGPDSGDNGNDLLEAGEIWEYIATYNITADDINAGHVDNQAQVTADVFNFPGLSAQDLSDDNSVLEDDITSTDLISCQTPSIQLIKEGQATIDADADTCIDGILYTFTVTNTGNVDLHSVVLTDDKIGGVVPGPLPGEDDGNDGILSVGEDWIYQGTYALVIPQDTDNGFVINQADVTALSVGNDTPVVDNQIIQTDLPVDLCAPAPAIQLIKTGDPSVDADANGCVDGILYTFTVTNIGNVDLHTVVLNDDKIGGIVPGPLPGEDDGNDGILSVGEDWVYQGTYALVLPDDENNGFVINNADVAALSVGDNTPVADNQQVQTNLPLPLCPPAPSIQLIKTGDPSVDLDANGCIDGILYTFTVTNIGNVDLHTVVLNDDKIGGVVPGPLPGEDDGNDGILSVGEDWVFQGTYSLVLPDDENNGFVINNADVSALSVGDNTPVADNQQVQTDLPPSLCPPSPAIQLIKTGDPNVDADANGCVDGILYTFTVTNIGNVDLQNIVLNDDKIGGVVPGPEPNEDDGNDGILSIGEDWIFQATYNLVQADIDAGFVINNADVSALSVGDNTPVADNQQVQTDLPVDLCAPAPSIGAIKQGQLIDEDVDGCIDSILFTFTVTNTGNVDLQNIVLNDPLLGGDVPGPVNGTDNGGDGILSVGESWSYEATYTLTDIDKGNGVVDNQATVTASSVGDNTPVADLSDDNSLTEDQLTTVVLPVDLCAPMPGLALIKTGTLVDLNADGCNETILYSFRVLNTGGMDLQSIVVTDPLLGGNINGPIANTDENNDGILSVGESWNYEILYAITQQDIVMGSVTNQATATGASVGDNQDVSDFSDDDSWLEDDPTNTSVPNDVCTLGSATIGLIKTGALADTNNDECPESILYTFSVTNTGEFELNDVQLTDQQLLGGTIAGPVDGTDNGNDGVLSLGETWTYNATYPISEQDVLNGFVTNQATVTANTIGIVASIFDLSDDDSLDENDMTMTSVPDYMCSTDSGSDEPFEIFSGITPNGDGFNDYFRINGIENYPDNVLKIFNRWGALVYESEGYGIGNNLFYGVSEGKATILKEKTLPSGTYFYVLNFPTDNPGQESYSGYLYINRN